MRYTFKFPLLGGKVQMFHEGDMGIVVEKESQVVCVYGIDCEHQTILCAIPLCPLRLLKGAEYTIAFSGHTATVRAGDPEIAIDYQNKKCATNKGIACYGSDAWGQDVQVDWSYFRK